MSDRPAQRSRPSLLIALCVAAAGCGEPSAGGQTGDPGVVDDTDIGPEPDYVSLEPSVGDGIPPGPGGECDSVAATAGIAEPDAAGLSPLDPTRGLFLERSSGRVIDLADPDSPRRRARLELGRVLSAHPLAAGRTLLAVQRPAAGFALSAERAAELGDYRLMLVDFGDPDAPAVLAERAIAGDIALAAVLERVQGTRVIAVADEISRDCIGPTKHTTLHTFALRGDALELDETLDLGDEVSAVAVRSALLLVLEGVRDQRTGQSSPVRASFIALSAEDGLQRSATVTAPGPLGLQPRLWVEQQAAIWTLAAIGEDGKRVLRYDLSDPVAPRVVADCALPASGELGGLWVLGERMLLTSWPNQDGNTLFELAADCAISERPDQWLARIPGSDALIELDFGDAAALEARVITSAGPQPVATARVALDRAAAPWGSSVLANAVGFQASDGSLEPHLLAVPLQSGAGKLSQSALQLFSFSASSISARGVLAPAASLAAATATGVAALSAGDHGLLSSFALDAQAAPEPRASLELNPNFARGYALGSEHWLRLRRPPGFIRADGGADQPLSEDALLHPMPDSLAALEVIATGGDPELAPALAQIGVNPHAQLVRAGDLFVSVANREQSGPGTTRLELFDFADPLAPVARGTLETDALWLQDNSGSLRGPAIECLDCDPPGGDGPYGLTTPRALVLRGYRWIAVEDEKHGGHSSFAFEIVDLSDPDHPRLGRTLTMPAEDRAHGALVVGDSVYYHYARPVPGDPTRARYFVQRIGLREPAKPELPKAMNVPGTLVAVRDQDTLYTVELSRAGAGLRATLHRLQVRNGFARIAASHALGDRRANAVSLADDRVLVDLGAGLNQPEPVVDGTSLMADAPLRLLALDAQSLERLAEGDVAHGALRLGASERAVGYMAWSGTLFVDPSAPSDLSRQRFLFGSGAPATAARLHFAGDRMLLSDPDSGRLQELALEPARGSAANDEQPSACEPPSAGDLEPNACRLAQRLMQCTSRGGATGTCLDACSEDDGFTADRCENQCQPEEYAAACGGVGPMAGSNAPPAPDCRSVFGPSPGGGMTFYCCPC